MALREIFLALNMDWTQLTELFACILQSISRD